MNLQPYKVEVIEHFEDWFVCSDTIGLFNTLNEAISIFLNERREILEMKRSTDGIDECITENFGNDWSDNDDDEYSKGFVIVIYNNDEEVVSQCFEYHAASSSIKSDSVFEFHNEKLTAEEADILMARLK